MKSTWTIETMDELLNAHMDKLGLPCGPHGEFPWQWIRHVRWWEFWRYHLIARDDYVLSRASEIVLARKLADEIRSGAIER